MHCFLFALLAMLGLEIVSIVLVANWLGVWTTLMLMLVSFIFGSFFLRRVTGLSSLIMGATVFREGKSVSLYQLLWPIRLPLAAVFFILPGFFSSLLALILLIPFKGKSLSGKQNTSFEYTFDSFRKTHASYSDDDVIDGDFVVKSSAHSSDSDTRLIEERNHH